jgi:ribosomal-protein-alanine N-acetyltransferase
MCREDISQVAEIDREAFPTLWPPVNYQRELQNSLAYYLVACDDERVVEPVMAAPKKGLSGMITRARQLFNQSRSPAKELPASGRQYIVGFAGTWIMAGEAHITNIAVRESYRCQGIGELLLISTIDLASKLDAHILTLEVRASNTTAQALYYKYGFSQVGLRRGYYIDDKEDAVLMSTEDISSASFQLHLQQLKQAHSRKLGIALYQIGQAD